MNRGSRLFVFFLNSSISIELIRGMSEGNPEEKVPISSPPSLTDTLSKQIRVGNKSINWTG